MYESGDIRVDRSFARFGSKSFAINKINSVDVRTQTRKGSKAYFWLWPLAAIFLLAAIGSEAQGAALFIGILLALAGLRAWLRRKPVTTYGLYLVTSSNEAQALQSQDRDEIERLRLAIEAAMAGAA